MEWIVHRGRGSCSLFLGQRVEEVRKLLGRPDSVVSEFDGHYYYVYRKLGLQVDFGSRLGVAKCLFFYRGSVEGYNQSPAETPEGLRPGISKGDVTAALGPADRDAGVLNSGESLVRGWVWYKSGIQFDFNDDGVVDVMVIFDPREGFSDQLF